MAIEAIIISACTGRETSCIIRKAMYYCPYHGNSFGQKAHTSDVRGVDEL